MRITAAALAVAALLLAFVANAGAGTCWDAGRFLILGQEPLLDTSGGIEALVVEGRRMSIDNQCAPVRLRPTGRRRVSATWRACAGAAGKVRLQAKFSPDCAAMVGTLAVGTASVKKAFAARVSYCGDGVLDPNGPEECDIGIPCPAGRHCVFTCRCLLDDEAPTSSTTTLRSTSTTTTSRPPTTSTTSTSTTSTSATSLPTTTSTSTTSTSTTTVPTTTSTSTTSTSTTTVPTTTTTSTSTTSTSTSTTSTSTSTSTTSTSTSTTSTSTSTTSTSTSTTTIPPPVSLSANVQPIFTSRCAIAPCHTGAFPAQGLDLRTGASYGALVNVFSTQCTSTKRVAPGDPSMSYLVWKIQNSGPCLMGTRMPAASSLPAANITTIVNWIAQGAPNN